MARTDRGASGNVGAELRLKLAAALARRRVDLGLTQKELAARLGKPQSSISELENAQGNPTLQTIEQVARALGAGVEVVVREDGPRPAPMRPKAEPRLPARVAGLARGKRRGR